MWFQRFMWQTYQTNRTIHYQAEYAIDLNKLYLTHNTMHCLYVLVKSNYAFGRLLVIPAMYRYLNHGQENSAANYMVQLDRLSMKCLLLPKHDSILK